MAQFLRPNNGYCHVCLVPGALQLQQSLLHTHSAALVSFWTTFQALPSAHHVVIHQNGTGTGTPIPRNRPLLPQRVQSLLVRGTLAVDQVHGGRDQLRGDRIDLQKNRGRGCTCGRRVC